MKDTLREEAVEVKYNGFENTTGGAHSISVG